MNNDLSKCKSSKFSILPKFNYQVNDKIVSDIADSTDVKELSDANNDENRGLVIIMDEIKVKSQTLQLENEIYLNTNDMELQKVDHDTSKANIVEEDTFILRCNFDESIAKIKGKIVKSRY